MGQVRPNARQIGRMRAQLERHLNGTGVVLDRGNEKTRTSTRLHALPNRADPPKECAGFKDDLRQYEHGNTGRVPLAAFYGAAVNNGSWQFSESAEYLKAQQWLCRRKPPATP